MDNHQIVFDEMSKDFLEKFVAFSYEDVCKNIFVELCAHKSIDFVPSRVGSYCLNDLSLDTELDIMAVDNQNKALFIGECKYHKKPVEARVYFDLKQKIAKTTEIHKAFPGYKILLGIFSKSGFEKRLVEIAADNHDLLLINETYRR